MLLLSRLPLRVASLGALLLAALVWPSTAPAYFVRPVVTFGVGQTLDGLIVDGATSNMVEFNDASRSARSFVDLETGEMSLFALGVGSTVSSSGQGVMGDTLNFQNGAGTIVNFEFGLEATIDASILVDSANQSFLTWRVALAVFEAGLVDHTNFFGNALQDDPGDIPPIFFELVQGDLNDPPADIENFEVSEFISGNVILPSDDETYDVFYLAALAGISNEELADYVLDGENTAFAGLDTEPGVDVSSGSGVFLGFPQIVPEPAPFALVALGLGWLARGRGRAA